MSKNWKDLSRETHSQVSHPVGGHCFFFRFEADLTGVRLNGCTGDQNNAGSDLMVGRISVLGS